MVLCDHTALVVNMACFGLRNKPRTFQMLKLVSGWETSQHALMGRVHRFRHAIFVEEKGWQDLLRADGLERDQFDDVHALHQICSRGDDIVGYQRLLPTTGRIC